MANSTYKHYNLSLPRDYKKTFNVASFLGADFQRSQLNVADYHAVDMKNIIWRDKVLQKRQGYIQLGSMPEGNVNGIYQFVAGDGNEHIIFHIGIHLYELTGVEKNSTYIDFNYTKLTTYDTENTDGTKIANHSSQGFVHKNKLYILDGNRFSVLYYGSNGWVIEDVEESAYIPTTTINIPYTDGSTAGSAPLDDVNLLTMWRKNTMISGTYTGENKRTTDFWEYPLDTYITPLNSILNLTITISYLEKTDDNTVENYVYDGVNYIRKKLELKPSGVNIGNRTSLDVYEDEEITQYMYVEAVDINSQGRLNAAMSVGIVYVNTSGTYIAVTSDSVYATYTSGTTYYYKRDTLNQRIDLYYYDTILKEYVSATNTEYKANRQYFTKATKTISTGQNYGRYALYKEGTQNPSEWYGYLSVGDEDTNAKLVLFDDYKAPTLEPNIMITFPHYTEGEADKINKCQFGIVYNNRLFLSGNPDFPNTDWHSSPISSGLDDVGYDDFTYFSDLDYCAYGSSDTAVVGYDIYRDGDLIAVKEASMREATLYRREYKLITATDYAGNEISGSYEEAFPCFDINIQGGFGGLSHKSIINYMGDTLIFTKNGIKVLSSSNTAYNNQKFLYDVSTNINPKLAQDNDLNENAFLYVFGEKLLLRTNNCTYIGEYNLKNENEYEWFVLDNVNAKAFFVVDRELYFVDTNNGIKRFNSDEYYFKDRNLVSGGLSFFQNELLTISVDYSDKIEDGYSFHPTNEFGEFPFQMLGSISSQTDSLGRSYTTIPSNIADYFYDGMKVVLFSSTAGGYDIYAYLKQMKNENDMEIPNTYYLLDEDGENMGGARHYSIAREIFYNSIGIVDISSRSDNGIDFTVKDEFGNNIDYTYSQTLHTENSEYDIGYIGSETDVEAYYETKPFDMGTITYEKTIWNYMYANDSNLASQINIGYKGSRLLGDFEIATGSREIRFDKYSFNTVSFVNDGLPHLYVRHRVIPNVTFIKFLFQNNGDTNMALTKLSLTYTIPQQARGSK